MIASAGVGCKRMLDGIRFADQNFTKSDLCCQESVANVTRTDRLA